MDDKKEIKEFVFPKQFIVGDYVHIDVNLREYPGPSGVLATSSRIVSVRASTESRDDISLLTKPCLRCCNCGFAVTENMKLPIRDLHDPIVPQQYKGQGIFTRDYVRVPLDFDELRNPSFEYSDYVACTPSCALKYMYDDATLRPSHVPHLFAMMMWMRHRHDEPVNAAPSVDCLSYMYRTSLTPITTTGLSVASFYYLLSNLNFIGFKQMAPEYIPPLENEHLAVKNNDTRFTQYYSLDLLPPQALLAIKLPKEIQFVGIQLDGNTEVDTDTDFATDTIHQQQQQTQPTSIQKK